MLWFGVLFFVSIWQAIQALPPGQINDNQNEGHLKTFYDAISLKQFFADRLKPKLLPSQFPRHELGNLRSLSANPISSSFKHYPLLSDLRFKADDILFDVNNQKRDETEEEDVPSFTSSFSLGNLKVDEFDMAMAKSISQSDRGSLSISGWVKSLISSLGFFDEREVLTGNDEDIEIDGEIEIDATAASASASDDDDDDHDDNEKEEELHEDDPEIVSAEKVSLDSNELAEDFSDDFEDEEDEHVSSEDNEVDNSFDPLPVKKRKVSFQEFSANENKSSIGTQKPKRKKRRISKPSKPVQPPAIPDAGEPAADQEETSENSPAEPETEPDKAAQVDATVVNLIIAISCVCGVILVFLTVTFAQLYKKKNQEKKLNQFERVQLSNFASNQLSTCIFTS